MACGEVDPPRPCVSVEKIPKRICRYQVTAHTTSVVQVPVEGTLPV